MLFVVNAHVLYSGDSSESCYMENVFEQGSNKLHGRTVKLIYDKNNGLQRLVLVKKHDDWCDFSVDVVECVKGDIRVGDKIFARSFSAKDKGWQEHFYNHRTKTEFHGTVLFFHTYDKMDWRDWFRLRMKEENKYLEEINKGNTYIQGENNVYTDNETIKGSNNVNRNNVYIAGDNNTVKGNSHTQGSNNVYEDNIIIGGSDNDVRGESTEGRSNQTVKGEVIDRSGSGDSGGGGGGGSSRKSYRSYGGGEDPETNYPALFKALAVLSIISFLSYHLRNRWGLFEIIFDIAILLLVFWIWLVGFFVLGDFLPQEIRREICLFYVGIPLILISVPFGVSGFIGWAAGGLCLLWGIGELFIKYPIYFAILTFVIIIIYYWYRLYKSNKQQKQKKIPSSIPVTPVKQPVDINKIIENQMKKSNPQPLLISEDCSCQSKARTETTSSIKSISRYDEHITDSKSRPQISMEKNYTNDLFESEEKEQSNFIVPLIAMPLSNRSSVISKLSIGDLLTMQKTKHYEGIKVVDKQTNVIGEISRDVARIILAKLAKGSPYECTVYKISGTDVEVFITKAKEPPLWVRVAVDAKQGYVGCKASKILHSIFCPDAEMIKESNRVFFKRRKDAVEAGYYPCKKCKAFNRRQR